MKNSRALDVVKAAYRLELSEREWLEALAREFYTEHDQGFGVAAFSFAASESNQFRWSELVTFGTRNELLHENLTRVLDTVTPEVVQRTVLGKSGLLSGSEAMNLTPAEYVAHWLPRQFGQPFGAFDIVALNVREPSGSGVVLLTPRNEVTLVQKRTAAPWALCTAHLSSALRLRRSLVREPEKEKIAGEAVLESSGKVVHADGPAKSPSARDALRDAVKVAAHAKDARRATSEQALTAWRALVLGRWSLVEQFDTDGHHYIVAKKNDPDVADPRGLVLRERQVATLAAMGRTVRLIAYELGLSESTVSGYLKSAMHKLGARTRAELVTRIRAPLA
jgi:DNA-binding CsgD family transcriptional regulator